jgi:HK97 family phage prohead protease
MNAILGDVKNRALDGQSNAFGKPFRYKDGIVMLKASCFGNVDDHNVRFLIDHNEQCEVGDTDGALELMVDSDGIQFRLNLEKAKGGNVVARMCEVDSRAAISVGCDILEEHDETIAGYTVRVITKARLKEISVCGAGAAGDDAFAMLVDTTVTPKPVAGSRSMTFQAGHILHKVSRKVRAVKKAIAAMYDDAPQAVTWSMSLAQSNALQSERYDELAANAKQRLLFR